ncbi:MAG TPA: YfiR family protein, partial [Gammaproteobacteria bacterium]|nr:YfiR family protein [Gammaproteobacteria bacterium]
PDQFPGPDTPFLIGIAGDTALAAELERLTVDHRVNGHSIAVKLVEPGNDLEGLDVLFIGRGSADLEHLLRAAMAAAHPILTVTENDAFIPFGSIINLVLDHQRVRFEVSLYAAERSGIKINSRLLAIARRVYGPRTSTE